MRDRIRWVRMRSALLGLLLGAGLSMNASAWDSVGHRLSVGVALQFLEGQTREQLLDLLRAHPRYQQDFVSAMPGSVQRGTEQARALWLLGQAAAWPDIARGLAEPERERYNRPHWHYTDGAWVRGRATGQGNVYVDRSPFPDLQGLAATQVRSEREASNIVTALDYNARLFSDASRPQSARAVALCWLLHLLGDLHQPLHTGSLFSSSLFDDGDRGGNGIRIGRSNLHAVWDRALREAGVEAELPGLIDRARELPSVEDSADWTAWLQESRELLHRDVYDGSLLGAIRRAERQEENLPPQTLSDDYRRRMQALARERLAVAGLRIAAWLNQHSPR